MDTRIPSSSSSAQITASAGEQHARLPATSAKRQRPSDLEPTSVQSISTPPVSSNAPPTVAVASSSSSSNVGIQFPVELVKKRLKQGQYSRGVGRASAVYMAAVLEYLTAEVLELAGNQTEQTDQQQTKRIDPKHLQMAVLHDRELAQLLGVAPAPEEEPTADIDSVISQFTAAANATDTRPAIASVQSAAVHLSKSSPASDRGVKK